MDICLFSHYFRVFVKALSASKKTLDFKLFSNLLRLAFINGNLSTKNSYTIHAHTHFSISDAIAEILPLNLPLS